MCKDTTRYLATFLLTASLALLPACGGDSSGGSSGSSTTPPGSTGGGTGAGTGAGTTQPPALTWLKGDLHTHSSYSDGIRFVGDAPAIGLQLAEQAGLDFVSLTDHRTHDGTADPGFTSTRMILLAGEEWGGGDNGSPGNPGHAGAHGLTADIPDLVDATQPVSTWNDQVQAVIDEVHRQGGVWVINHPTNHGIPWIWNVTGADGVEVWNAFWALHAVVPMDETMLWDGVGTTLQAAGHTPMGPLLDVTRTPPAGGAMAQALSFYEGMLNQGHRLACVGGGDRHIFVMPGGPTTHVGVYSRDVAGVLEGIRAGRTYVTAHPNGPRVELLADADGDGVFETTIGGEIPAGQPVEILVRISNTPGGHISLIRSGTTVETLEAFQDPLELRFTDTPQAGDWYRVNFRERIDMTLPGATALATVALSPALQNGWEWGSVASYATVLAAINSIPHIQALPAMNTQMPVLDIPPEYTRILNADPSDPEWSMAAITSPIYVAPSP